MENVVEDPQAPGAGLVLTSRTTSARAHDPRELARGIEARLARGTQDLADAARRVRAGSDPEAIHDLRVAARRLLHCTPSVGTAVPRASPPGADTPAGNQRLPDVRVNASYAASAVDSVAPASSR